VRDRPIVFAGCEDRRSGRVQDLSVLPDPDVEGEGPAHRAGEEEVALVVFPRPTGRPPATRSWPDSVGSETRTRVLVTLRLLGSSFQRELARILDRSPSVVHSLNPRYFGIKELEALLSRIGQADTELRQRAGDLRRRPRRAGKRL
jgi:hypothetical protein